jgi:hypothetical protein
MFRIRIAYAAESAVTAAAGTFGALTDSKSAWRPKSAIAFDVVNVAKLRGEPDARPARQPGESIGEGEWAGPPHVFEQFRKPSRVAKPDEPKPAIFGGTQHEIVTPQEAEGGRHCGSAESRDVGPDEHHWPARESTERTVHPTAEISAPLGGDLARPAAGPQPMASSVRGYCDPQPPPPVGAQPAEQQRDHQPLEA